MLSEKHTRRLGILAMAIAAAVILAAMGYGGASGGGAGISEDSKTAYTKNIFDKSRVIHMEITVSEEKFRELLDNAAREEYVPCDIRVNGTDYPYAAIRAKGNSSLSMVASSDSDRYSFKVKFDEYIDGRTLDGLSKINLNNMIGDNTYMKEYLAYDMMSYLGVPAPAYAFVNIKINGEPWGLYLALEAIEEEFIQRYFTSRGVSKGNLYKPESVGMGGGRIGGMGGGRIDGMGGGEIGGRIDGMGGGEIGGMGGGRIDGMGGGGTGGGNLVYSGDDSAAYSAIFGNAVFKTTGEKDYARVIEMMKRLDSMTEIEKVLDVENVLKYFAVNTFVVNLDSYAGTMKHNYYLYELDGVCYILPWDYNLAFGGFHSSGASEVINFPIDAPYTDSAENTPLIAKLLQVEEYRELYHSYYRDLIENYTSRSDALIDSLDALIGEYVREDATAFTDYATYQTAVEQLKIYMRDRSEAILLQLDGTQSATGYGDYETTLDLKALGSMGMGNRGGEGMFANRNAGADEIPEGIAERPSGGEAQNPQQGEAQNLQQGAAQKPQRGEAQNPQQGEAQSQRPGGGGGQFPARETQNGRENPFGSLSQTPDSGQNAYLVLGITFGAMLSGLLLVLWYRPKKYRLK